MNSKISPLKLGWTMIRVSKSGRASTVLRRLGFWRVGPAELNNRNGADWIRPGQTRSKFEAFDWSKLAAAGLEGIAFWVSDLQWKHNSAMTDLQWRNRAIIETNFNSKWPTGRR